MLEPLRLSGMLLIAPMQFDELCQVVGDRFRQNGAIEHPQPLVEPTIEGRRRRLMLRCPCPVASRDGGTAWTPCLAVVTLGSAHGRSVKKGDRLNAAGAAHDRGLFHEVLAIFREQERRAL